MPDDKVVHVPGTGLMSFPGDMPDHEVAGSIQQHLQSLGTAALAAAPAPIQRMVSGLGVQFTPMTGDVQRTTNNSQQMLAGVQQGSPNVIEVRNPAQFNDPAAARQLAAHEAMPIPQRPKEGHQDLPAPRDGAHLQVACASWQSLQG